MGAAGGPDNMTQDSPADEHRSTMMEREFEEIEIDCLPGAFFFGSVDFGVDGDAPCVERILLQAWNGEPSLILDLNSPGFYRTVFDALADKLLHRFAEDAWDLVPPFDPVREYGIHWGRP